MLEFIKENIFISSTITEESNQLLGFLRSNEVEILDVESGESIIKEGIAFGFLIFRIDIVF